MELLVTIECFLTDTGKTVLLGQEVFLLSLVQSDLSFPAIPFAAVHQEHHRYHDTEKDPHSAYYKGHFWTYVTPQLAPFKRRYLVGDGKDHFRKLLRDPILQVQERYYWFIILGWIAFLLLTTFDPFSIIYGLLAPAGLLKLFANLLFGYSHRDRKPHNDFWLASDIR